MYLQSNIRLPIRRGSAIALVLLALAAARFAAAAVGISVFGQWQISIGSENLINGAGSDLRREFESSLDAFSVDITGKPGRWRVEVRLGKAAWHDQLNLSIRRTGDGTGGGTVSGGREYQVLLNRNEVFFSGDDDKAGVPVQLKLTGVSLQIPPRVYRAKVWYTVLDV